MEIIKGQYKRFQKEFEELGCKVVREDNNLIIDDRYKFNLDTSWYTNLITGKKWRNKDNLIREIKGLKNIE